MITLTEALAELKLIKSKIDKKRTFILQNLGRQEGAKDQLEKNGGTDKVLASEMQAVNDLMERLVRIRSAIASANASTTVDILGVKRTIADWLVWRRDVAPLIKDFERHILSGINGLKQNAKNSGFRVVNAAGEASVPTDVIICLDEKGLSETSERIQEILDTLDGKLSLHNATVQIEAA